MKIRGSVVSLSFIFRHPQEDIYIKKKSNVKTRATIDVRHFLPEAPHFRRLRYVLLDGKKLTKRKNETATYHRMKNPMV